MMELATSGALLQELNTDASPERPKAILAGTLMVVRSTPLTTSESSSPTRSVPNVPASLRDTRTMVLVIFGVLLLSLSTAKFLERLRMIHAGIPTVVRSAKLKSSSGSASSLERSLRSPTDTKTTVARSGAPLQILSTVKSLERPKTETCWYPFGGEEHTTDDFKLIKSHKFSEECHGKAQGHQEEGGKLWCAVANTDWGAIPGKAKDGECWYPYAGEEHSTSDFRYVCSGKPEDHEGSSSSSESSDSSCSSSSSSSSEESEKEEEPEEEEEEEEVEEVEEEEEGEDSEDEENEKDDDHDKRGAALRALMGIVGRPVAIKGCNGKYLRNVHHPLLCFDANKIGLWEQFMILPLDNG
jgi:hypothetical protein